MAIHFSNALFFKKIFISKIGEKNTKYGALK
jgi:hypothetical protein